MAWVWKVTPPDSPDIRAGWFSEEHFAHAPAKKRARQTENEGRRGKGVTASRASEAPRQYAGKVQGRSPHTQMAFGQKTANNIGMRPGRSLGKTAH